MPPPTRQSLLDLGVPPPVAGRVPLLVEQVVIAAGLLFYRSHGLALDAPLTFRAISSTTLGAPPAALPSPELVEGTVYYARPTSSDAFQVATAPSPSPPIASFAATASARFGFLVDPGAALDLAIQRAWTVVQSDCTAHGGDTAAPLLTDAARALAARFYVVTLCTGDPTKAAQYDGLARLYAEIYAPKLAAFFTGTPIRGAVDATPGIVEDGAVLVQLPRGPFDLRRHGEDVA